MTQTKSGLKQLKPGEVLFHDGDDAHSLYIIQKGQLRLYKPKGAGFIELTTLRAGEVIGEMAFFDEDGSGQKRSCSASAINGVEVIEISFVAFAKTMHSLNPWFKTIINTLAERLRKTNTRVKELEDNQAVSYGKKSGYEFIKPIEVMRVLGTLFLVARAHGEVKSKAFVISRKALTLYSKDLYQIQDVKMESLIKILSDLGWMETAKDESNMPNILILKNIEIIRQIFIFYNGERHLSEEKKMNISDKCQKIITKMLELGPRELLMDIPNLKTVDDVAPKFTKYYDVSPILNYYKDKNIFLDIDLLEEGRNLGLFGEAFMEDGKYLIETDFNKLQKLYPVIRFMNLVRKLNLEKAR